LPTWRDILPSTRVALRAIRPTEDGLVIEAEGQTWSLSTLWASVDGAP
jgi:hypothetical protein